MDLFNRKKVITLNNEIVKLKEHIIEIEQQKDKDKKKIESLYEKLKEQYLLNNKYLKIINELQYQNSDKTKNYDIKHLTKIINQFEKIIFDNKLIFDEEKFKNIILNNLDKNTLIFFDNFCIFEKSENYYENIEEINKYLNSLQNKDYVEFYGKFYYQKIDSLLSFFGYINIKEISNKDIEELYKRIDYVSNGIIKKRSISKGYKTKNLINLFKYIEDVYEEIEKILFINDKEYLVKKTSLLLKNVELFCDKKNINLYKYSLNNNDNLKTYESYKKYKAITEGFIYEKFIFEELEKISKDFKSNLDKQKEDEGIDIYNKYLDLGIQVKNYNYLNKVKQPTKNKIIGEILNNMNNKNIGTVFIIMKSRNLNYFIFKDAEKSNIKIL